MLKQATILLFLAFEAFLCALAFLAGWLLYGHVADQYLEVRQNTHREEIDALAKKVSQRTGRGKR